MDRAVLDVGFLTVTAAFKLGEFPNLDCEVLQMPYNGQHQDMYIFLPNKVGGLQELETKLFNAETCHEWYPLLGKMPVKLVKVAIPAFHLEMYKSMKSTLCRMGLQSIFSPEAGALKAWTKTGDCCITDYYQHIKIVTSFQGKYSVPSKKNIRRMSIINNMGKPANFRANHPFLFMVHDRATDAVQFLGRICYPNQKHVKQ